MHKNLRIHEKGVMEGMSLSDVVQDFPAGICINACRFLVRNRARVVRILPGMGGQKFQGQGWEIELNFLPLEREEAADLEAFLLSLRAGSG
jgi:hypothetical protein